MTQDEYDKMLLIKGLYENANWSFRRIGRFCGHSPTHTKRLYLKALEQLHDKNVDNFPKSRKTIDLRYVGSTSDIEYLEGNINHNVCGGGNKVDQTNYD